MSTRIDMIGVFVTDLARMVAFYRDVLGFEITWDGNGPYAEFANDGVRFAMYERAQLPGLLGQTPGYPAGLNGTFELAIDLPTSADADRLYAQVIAAGAQPVYARTRRAVGHALVDDRGPGGQFDRDRVVGAIEMNTVAIGLDERMPLELRQLARVRPVEPSAPGR